MGNFRTYIFDNAHHFVTYCNAWYCTRYTPMLDMKVA